MLLRQFREIKFYLRLEDKHQCSGMCEPSLFYFGKDLHEGPPGKTCFTPLKDFLSGSANSFAFLSIITGVLALLQFWLHFFLYNRPMPMDPGASDGKQVAMNTEQANIDSEQAEQATNT